jgi:hypothetical protein
MFDVLNIMKSLTSCKGFSDGMTVNDVLHVSVATA